MTNVSQRMILLLGNHRLLMRREQVHKVACNHRLTTDIKLQPLQTSENAWCWFAMDHSEDEPEMQQFACRFKVCFNISTLMWINYRMFGGNWFIGVTQWMLVWWQPQLITVIVVASVHMWGYYNNSSYRFFMSSVIATRGQSTSLLCNSCSNGDSIHGPVICSNILHINVCVWKKLLLLFCTFKAESKVDVESRIELQQS